MLKVVVMSLSLVFLSFNARAGQVLGAEKFGLSEETGYREVVQDPSTCKSADQLVYTNYPGSDSPQFIRKCNGANIGWVELTVNGDNLEFNSFDNGHTFNIVNQHSDTNIYTCGHSRDDEFKNEAIKPSRDVEENFWKLADLKRRKAPFKIQLFYNEYVMSGKCIGRITEL
jgi:hypothetical protein